MTGRVRADQSDDLAAPLPRWSYAGARRMRELTRCRPETARRLLQSPSIEAGPKTDRPSPNIDNRMARVVAGDEQ